MALDPFTEGLAFGRAILDKIWPDAEKKDERAYQIATMLGERDSKRDSEQSEINKIEAANQNIFVSGWRPFIGWCCGGAYAYHFILQPFLIFLVTATQRTLNTAQLPQLDMGELSMVLFGMLGLGAMRSYEKVKGNGK